MESEYLRARQKIKAVLIHELMESLHISFEEAADAYSIPENRWSYFHSLIDMLYPPISVGDILRKEFMEPCGITVEDLAGNIHVPITLIEDIVLNGGRISTDMSLRLAKYFGVSDRFFLDVQNDLDIRYMKPQMQAKLDAISEIDGVMMPGKTMFVG